VRGVGFIYRGFGRTREDGNECSGNGRANEGVDKRCGGGMEL